MDRREFLRTVLAGAAAFALSKWRTVSAGAAEGETAAARSTVAIKRFGEERGAPAAVRAALDLLGGADKVVKRGDVVVVKQSFF